jgi:hypothetical protein
MKFFFQDNIRFAGPSRLSEGPGTPEKQQNFFLARQNFFFSNIPPGLSKFSAVKSQVFLKRI